MKEIEPKRKRKKPPTKIKEEELRRDVEKYPDAYQYERAKRLGVSQRGIGLALKRMGISCKKKTYCHPKADAQKRQEFQECLQAHKEAGRTIVNIDESGFAEDMPRGYGYAPVGKRCFGKRNWGARGRTNVIGALLASCLLTVALFKGSINANVFYAWVAQDLLPRLPPHCVIVIDNAAFHKRADIRLLFQDAGHTLLFLPPYSPDLNPIEHKWAQAKALRKQFFCSVDDLFANHVF
jgi:transposase